MTLLQKGKIVMWGAFADRAVLLVLLVLASFNRAAFVVAGAWVSAVLFLILKVAWDIRHVVDDEEGES